MMETDSKEFTQLYYLLCAGWLVFTMIFVLLSERKRNVSLKASLGDRWRIALKDQLFQIALICLTIAVGWCIMAISSGGMISLRVSANIMSCVGLYLFWMIIVSMYLVSQLILREL